MAIGEAGSITTGSPTENQLITVNLTEPLTNPVFAFTATSNGGDDIVIRLVDQTVDADGNTTSFSFILEEWEYLDGPHPAVETINWLAVEEGVHTLPDGRIIEAGTSTVSSTGRNTGDSETFSGGFTDPPVVLTSVMSNNDSTTVDSDPSNITATGFDITLQEEEGQDGVHAAETIGWIAIEPGGDAISGTASASGDTITHNVSTLGLGATFTDSVVLAETQTLDGPDTANVSIDSQTNDSVSVFIDEEQSNDTETNHTTEVVGIVAFEDGLIPCLTKGTLIQTMTGAKPVEQLASGDLVETADGCGQRLQWIGRRTYGLADLKANMNLYPVRVTANALGNGLPRRDLLVSRQHRLLVRSKIAERMFGKAEVLIPAVKLTEMPGVYIDRTVKTVAYFHLLFEKHEVIFAEGTPTESLFTGPEALKSMSPQARAEIFQIFPELSRSDHVCEPARFIPEPQKQRQLVTRHLKNNRPLTGQAY